MSRTFGCVAVFLALALPAFAGEWHRHENLVCSDCHTNHNSANGQPMRYDNVPDPAQYMLRADAALALCLSCHDGSRSNAPDVITPVSYVGESAAGAFPNSGGTPTSQAHHLANPDPEVPPGGTVPMVLTCTTCHDPHGNDNYRNLWPDPLNKLIESVTVTSHQTVMANGGNPSQVYVPSNIIYKSGVSQWCGKCHGTPGDSDHPVDKAIWGSAFADYATWASVTLPRVPVHSPTDNTIPSQDDQVMCLSCHKAHGSDNYAALIYADGASPDSTCQECHNQ